MRSCSGSSSKLDLEPWQPWTVVDLSTVVARIRTRSRDMDNRIPNTQWILESTNHWSTLPSCIPFDRMLLANLSTACLVFQFQLYSL